MSILNKCKKDLALQLSEGLFSREYIEERLDNLIGLARVSGKVEVIENLSDKFKVDIQEVSDPQL